MHALSGKLIQIIGILTVIGLFGACTEPCLELSTRLCKCEDTDPEKQVCIQLKNQAASIRETNADEQEKCEELLDLNECQEEAICSQESSCGLNELNANAG